ncbi:LysR family transcriptional regulator [Pokkaliibacter sp. CJK22405]|uniref:LysR family transcriptional regulator n=1 Tax=Pokkaliibacter sp. CJK22405 TaxID=3384615 RepID=UPI00398535EF
MIRELKTFVSVCHCGSFAAAGAKVGLTQSAVSAQIRQLEESLGQALFDRTGRSAVLNAAGKRALALAEEILGLYQQMATPAQLEDFRGELRLGAINTVQTGLLPEVLVRLRQRAPGVETKLVPGVSLQLFNQVDAGELDLALIIRPSFPLPKELHTEPVAREPFVLLVPPSVEGDDPLHLLQTQPFIRYDRHSFGGRLVSRFLRQQRLTPTTVMELDELDAIVRMVECGLGVALLPEAGLWHQRAEGIRKLSLGEMTFHRELVLICRYGQRDAPLTRAFRDSLKTP